MYLGGDCSEKPKIICS